MPIGLIPLLGEGLWLREATDVLWAFVALLRSMPGRCSATT